MFIEFSPGYTVGSGEFLSELIETAGGINVYASEKGYVKLSEEKVIAANPQVILYPKNLIDDKSKKIARPNHSRAQRLGSARSGERKQAGRHR